MGNKELLNRINKIKSPIVKDVFLESFEKSDTKARKKLARIMESFEKDLSNNLNFKAKAIAAYVRYNIEDFHHKHLSDAQMKELNPLIRNAIYTFLKDEAERNSFEISFMCKGNLAPYWEDCQYVNAHSESK